MSDVVISVEGLGKKYRISHQGRQQGYTALRDVIAEKATNFFKKLKRKTSKSGSDFSISASQDFSPASQNLSVSSTEDFWALENVSFEVKQGEVVGIIGRNGAGKSTLLKILSRITEPTRGRVHIKGRVASLLEVGTGFHPELTGRENVFLNGAILGMSRVEIRKKFDEIVAFAEVEKFLDTPVKRYSSGMYVRLAFAVAAHLEPEILIVDEVLAVGDAEFQKKCLGKMESVSRSEGRTVLFVSHNMQAVRQLTRKALVLSKGTTDFFGETGIAVSRYLAQFQHSEDSVYDVSVSPRKFVGSQVARIERLWFPQKGHTIEFNEDLRFTVQISAKRKIASGSFSVTLCSAEGATVGSGFTADTLSIEPGAKHKFEISLESPRLSPGNYSCVVALNRGSWPNPFEVCDVVFDVLYFEVKPPECLDGTSSTWHSTWGSTVFRDLSATPLGDQPFASLKTTITQHKW